MKKSTLIALLVFAALLAGAVMTLNKKPERGITRINFTQVASNDIDRVVIVGNNAVELKKEGQTWRLANGKEADENAVKRLLDAIPTIDTTRLVSRDSERFAELEVDDDKGSTIKAYAKGAVVAEFVIGKSAEGGAYVRVGDAVYIADKVFPSVFSKPATAWYQLKLFKEKMEDVKRVEVKIKGAAPYALVKQNDDWQFEDASVVPEGFRFDKAAARNVVSSLVNVRARSVLEKDPGIETSALSSDADSLSFETVSGTKIHLSLGAEAEEKTYYAKVSGRDDVYMLAEYTAKALRKSALDLRDMAMVVLDKDKVKSLRINGFKGELTLEKQGADWKIGRSSQKIDDHFELDVQAIERRIAAMVSARGTRIAEGMNAAKAGLKKPTAFIIATLDDNSKVALQFGASFKEEERELWYAQGNADEAIYVVSPWTRDNVTGGLETFQKRHEEKTPNIDPAALQNLPPDVRASLMQQLQKKQQEQQMMQQLQAQMAAQNPPPKSDGDKAAKPKTATP